MRQPGMTGIGKSGTAEHPVESVWSEDVEPDVSASGGSAPLICYRGLMVRTPPFHGGNGGSIPPVVLCQCGRVVYDACLENMRS